MADNKSSSKKEYVAPRIVHSEKIEGRAVACLRATDAQCGGGPILS
jgi:hypothetical protein